MPEFLGIIEGINLELETIMHSWVIPAGCGKDGEPLSWNTTWKTPRIKEIPVELQEIHGFTHILIVRVKEN
jgi:hypothetical protein